MRGASSVVSGMQGLVAFGQFAEECHGFALLVPKREDCWFQSAKVRRCTAGSKARRLSMTRTVYGQVRGFNSIASVTCLLSMVWSSWETIWFNGLAAAPCFSFARPFFVVWVDSSW